MDTFQWQIEGEFGDVVAFEMDSLEECVQYARGRWDLDTRRWYAVNSETGERHQIRWLIEPRR